MKNILRFAPALVCCCSSLGACSAEPDRVEPVSSVHEAAGITDGWVGTWAASPQGDGTTFADKTLRQIVHTSIGGSSVRVQLSNVFGNQALTVDAIHVAERESGSSITAASDHVLKFAGQASVSVPAGQAATSDPVAFEVKPLSDLAVSFHVQATNGSTTAHGTGLQDNYVADGNHAGDASLNGAQVRGSYYFLTNVDVQNTAAWGAVVTLGASITDGVASGGNNNRRWPNDLAKRLNDAKIPVGVLNQGISGNRLLADGAGDSALKRFDRDVLAQAGVRWVIFSDDPINDLGNGNRPSGDQLIAGLKQLVTKAHAAKVKFWCSTLTPFQGSGGWSAQGETSRAAIIAFIKSADSGCDAIVDQDLATHDPAKPTWYLPAFDQGDHLHPNEKGLQAIADAVELKGFSAPEGSGGAGGAAGAAGAGAGGVVDNGGASSGGKAGASSAGAGLGGSLGGAGQAAGGASSSAGAATTPMAGHAGSSSQAGSSATTADGSQPGSDSGCGCKLVASGKTPSAPFAWLLAGLGLTALASRKRQRKG